MTMSKFPLTFENLTVKRVVDPETFTPGFEVKFVMPLMLTVDDKDTDYSDDTADFAGYLIDAIAAKIEEQVIEVKKLNNLE